MHKSNYDKASEVAMGKLRPKPDVSITISMKGGGGLSSLGDFPIIRRFMGSYTDEDAGYPDVEDYGGTMPLANKTVPVGYNPAAGRDTTGMLAGGSKDINYPDMPADADDFTYVENEKLRANILAGGGVGERGNYYTKVIGPDGQPRTMFHGKDRGPIDPNTLLGYQGQELKTFMPNLYGPMFNTAVGRDTAGMLAAGQTPTPDKFEDNEEYQLMGQPPEKQDLIKDTKDYIDQLSEISKESFTSSWGRAKDIATNPLAASNFLSAALDPSKNNFYGKDAPNIEPPDSLVREANKARGIGQRKGGGGLSSLNEMPIIRRQYGGDTYGEDTPDMDYTEDDFISYADIPGAQLSVTDTEDAQAASTTPTDASYLPDVAYMGDFAFAPDPQGRVGLMGPDEVAGVDIAQTYLSPDPKSSELGQYEDVSGLERFFAGLPVIGKALNLSKDRQRFVSDKELENRYGERAGFAAKLNNRTNQWAAGINKVKSDIDKRSEEEDPKTPEEIEKEEREGLLEVAEKTFDKGSFVENKGQGIPGYAASYGLASLFGAMGLLGTAEIDGIPVHVHEDGSVTPVSPEDEPGFDSSKMNITSDKEAKDLPTRKQYRPTTPKATTQDMIEEIYGTSPTRGEKRLASLESSGLQDRFRGVYGRPFRTI